MGSCYFLGSDAESLLQRQTGRYSSRSACAALFGYVAYAAQFRPRLCHVAHAADVPSNKQRNFARQLCIRCAMANIRVCGFRWYTKQPWHTDYLSNLLAASHATLPRFLATPLGGFLGISAKAGKKKFFGRRELWQAS